jgi:hypothetical protein
MLVVKRVVLISAISTFLFIGGCDSDGSSAFGTDTGAGDASVTDVEHNDVAAEAANNNPQAAVLLVEKASDLAGYKLTSSDAELFGAMNVISVEFDCDGGFRQEWVKTYEGLTPDLKWIEGNEIFIESVGYMGEDVDVIRWTGLDKFGQSGNDGRIYFRNESKELTVGESCFNSYDCDGGFFLKTIEQTNTCD